jgi:hypothetical protein
MEPTSTYCERCGNTGVELSGMHPGDDGLMRWTLFACGHMATQLDSGTVVVRDGADLRG